MEESRKDRKRPLLDFLDDCEDSPDPQDTVANRDPFDDGNISEFPALSDVESAIRVILSRIPSNTTYPKIVFKHQLYPIIQNQTEIESELEILRTTHKIRLLILPNGQIGIILHSDYIADIEKSIAVLKASKFESLEQSLKKFLTWLSSSTAASVLEADLLRSSDPTQQLTSNDIQNIVDQGYLFPHRSSKAAGLYYLSHKQIGDLIHAINSMTNYILKTIRQQQYKEISEDQISQRIFQSSLNSFDLEDIESSTQQQRKKKVKKIPRGLTSTAPTGLGWKYHLYDMIGKDLIFRVETGGLKGPVLRIKK